MANIKTIFGVGLLLAAISISCKKEEVTPLLTGDALVNDWILGEMKTWYLWNDKIPASPNMNQTPDKFFESILYRYDKDLRPDGDRFSWIEPDVNKLTASLSGESKTTGAEFQLYSKATGDDLGARIIYVHAGSPAAQAGLKRGDVIVNINVDNQQLTKTNYSTLLSSGVNYEFVLGSYDAVAKTWATNGKSAKATAVVLQKDPIHLDSIYTVGAKKVGYFVYHQFVTSPSGSTTPTYNQKMDKIFGKFKAAGINELVIDLRYNPGGYVTASNNLASLIAKGASSTKVFAKRQYNASMTPILEKQYGKEFFDEKFSDKTENVGNNLSRVFVLTSTRSASASELVINGLKPYMEVFLIGEQTTGKNVGSITIKDDKGRFSWGLQPIVMRSANALGQSDYTAGFKPNVTVKEILTETMYAFGDRRDPLLNEAFFQITGNRLARRGSLAEEVGVTKFATSFENNAGSGLIFDFKK